MRSKRKSILTDDMETLLFEAEEYVQGNRAQATLFDGR